MLEIQHHVLSNRFVLSEFKVALRTDNKLKYQKPSGDERLTYT